jgi:hypothetical protein
MTPNYQHPAFPDFGFNPGMDLRDWFAGQSLIPVIAMVRQPFFEKDIKYIAGTCYALADALILERQKKGRYNDPAK